MPGRRIENKIQGESFADNIKIFSAKKFAFSGPFATRKADTPPTKSRMDKFE